VTRKTKPPCGKKGCSASSGVCGRLTFGRGKLDRHGYWSHPCHACARAYERLSPGEQAWPLPPSPRAL